MKLLKLLNNGATDGNTSVTGGVDPRIDGEGCSGDDKGAVEAAGLFTGMAIQSDGLSVVSSV